MKILESQQSDLKKNIKEVLEWKTLEEITDLINSFKTEARNWQEHLKSMEIELQQISRDEERVLEETSQEQMTLGKLQKEEEDHNTRIDARNKNLQRLAETFQIRVKEDTFSSEVLVSNLMHQVDDKIRESKVQFEQLRNRFQREEQELQSKIDIARDTKAKLEQEITSKKRQAEDNKAEEWSVKTEIEDIEKSGEELVKLGRELEQAKTNWETACQELDEEQLKKEIRDQHQESNRLDDKLVIVDKEVQTLQLLSSEQGVEAASEAAELAYELSNKVSEVPARLQDNKKELENKLKEYDKLLQMKPAYERTDIMRTKEIPEMKESLHQTEEALDAARKQIKDLKEQLLGPKAKEQMAKDIQGDVVRIDQLQTELRRIDKEIQELQSKMPTGSSRSMEEALAEQEELRAQVSAIQRALHMKQESLRRHSERVNQLRERKNVLMEKKLKLESGQQKRRQLEERLQSCKQLKARELEDNKILKEKQVEAEELKSVIDKVKQRL
ncbi:DNA repair protein RAD50-like, partial [Schistocerca piceifrons]|uniref:DNA repair protein RAD50-like n=1 Tax=Schistocerca piceifrons TaxID=274613 RepID=UPI001F5FDD54